MATANRKTLFKIILVIQILLLFASGCLFLYKKATLYRQTFSLSDFILLGDFEREDKLTIEDINSTPGTVVSSGPLALKKGTYIVSLIYNTNTEGNVLKATDHFLSPSSFHSTPVSLSPNSRTVSLTIDIDQDTADLALEIDFQGKGYLELFDFSIHETSAHAKRGLFYSLITCMLLNLCYFISVFKLKQRQIFFLLSVIMLASSYPLFVDYLMVGHDLPYHLLRIEGIKTGLANGIFPVKIHPVWAHDYGYPTGVFYGDFLLYFPALLRLLGFSIQSSYQLFVFFINIITTLVSYFTFKRIFSSSKMGVLGSALYTLSLYRLINVYTRAAVGEYCAMIFLPIVLLGFYEILSSKQKRLSLQPAIFISLGLTGIIQSHVLSSEMTAFIIVLTCLIFIRRIFQPHIFLSLCMALGLTILLNLGFLIPFIDYYFQDFTVTSSSWNIRPIQRMGLFPLQLFSIFQSGIGGSSSVAGGIMNEMNLGMGITFIFGFFIYIYYLLCAPTEEKCGKVFRFSLFCFLYSCLTLYLCTHLVPWDAWAAAHPILEMLITRLEFPWRFLSLTTVFLTVCCCFSFQKMEVLFPKSRRIVVSGIIGMLVIGTGWYYYSFTSSGTPYRVYDTYELNTMQLYDYEYLPTGTKPDEIWENKVFVSEGLTLMGYNKRGTSVSFYVTGTEEGGYVELPLIFYKGYAAKTAETDSSLITSSGNNNVVRVDIPPYFSDHVSLSFREPLYWRAGEIISSITLILLAVYILTKCYTLFGNRYKNIGE